VADYLTSAGLVEALDRRAEMRAMQQRQMALRAAQLAAEQAAAEAAVARVEDGETDEGAGLPPAPTVAANTNDDATTQALTKVEQFKALNPATKPHRSARGRPRKGQRG
jgi:type II secretory pathway pseudopilin PulG